MVALRSLVAAFASTALLAQTAIGIIIIPLLLKLVPVR
jgi:hypothetical protein